MSEYHSFTSLIISFDTGPVPPPFCHKYSIAISRGEIGLKGALNLEYYDRDEITEEEVFDEGFSLDDDFQWEGALPGLWEDELKSKLSGTNWTKKIDADDGSSLSVKISESGKSELLYPADRRVWEVFAQDIIQAIFELGEKELPLQIEYLHVGHKNQKQGLSLNYSFAQREATVLNTNSDRKTIDWKEGQKLMQYIYFFDFMPEGASDKIPNDPGDYINPGDGLWYALGDELQGHLAIKKSKLIETLKSYL
jgi:hypothetical protein